MANEQIKINELAEGNINLSDFIAKAGASGIATKITLQKLADIITSASDSQFKGSLTIAQAAAAPTDGWYFPSEAGDFVLANGQTVTVVLENKLNILIVSGTHTVIEMLAIPVNISLEGTTFDVSDNVNGASMKLTYDTLTDLMITEDYVQNLRRQTQFQVFNNGSGDVSVIFDVNGSAVVTITGDMLLHTAYGTGGAGAYTRLVVSGGTKVITVPKYKSLYLDIDEALANATGDALPDSAYTMTADVADVDTLSDYPTDKVLLLSNWSEEIKGSNGLIKDYVTGKKASEVVSLKEIKQDLVLPFNYNNVQLKASAFVKKMTLNEQDVQITLLGDSILARTVHTSLFTTIEQQSRPPMMISKNIASGIWDKVDNGMTLFSRWDKASVFTETGSAWTSYFGETLKSAWDDALTRAGETREFLGTAAASVAFDFIADYKRLSFIYRTSTEGNNSLAVAVSGGDGKLEVWNGSAWVEANGTALNQLYSTTGTGYGNTEYQRRLKFRKVVAEIGNAHTITITKSATGSAESLMYWGIEYTKKDYIISVRNAARGSASIANLISWNRTEFGNFDTDLCFFEIPILNMKASQNKTPAEMWNLSTVGVQDFIYGNNEYELAVLSNNFTDFQVVTTMINEQVAWINSDGTLLDIIIDDVVYNSDDYFNQMSGRFIDDEVSGFINVERYLNAEALKIFGNLYKALQASSEASGASFTKDGTHLNDLGCETALRYLVPYFDFNIL